MSFIVQQPHSLTNPSDFYRVVEFRGWANFADDIARYLPVHAEVSSYGEAQRVCDDLNDSLEEAQ